MIKTDEQIFTKTILTELRKYGLTGKLALEATPVFAEWYKNDRYNKNDNSFAIILASQKGEIGRIASLNLQYHKDPKVKWVVAGNPDADKEALQNLSKAPDFLAVRTGKTEAGRFDPYHWDDTYNEAKKRFTYVSRKTSFLVSYRQAIAGNPGAKGAVLSAIARKGEYLDILLDNPALTAPVLRTIVQTGYKKEFFAYRKDQIFKKCAQHKLMTPNLLLLTAKNSGYDRQIMQDIIKHPNADDRVYDLFVSSPYSDLRLMAAKIPALPTKFVNKLMNDRNIGVRMAANDLALGVR